MVPFGPWPGNPAAVVTSVAEAALARAQSLLGPTLDTIVGTEFDNDRYYQAVTVGTGAVPVSQTARSGVISPTTGANAASQANVKPSGLNTHINNPQTGLWYSVHRAQVTSAIDANARLTYQITNNAGQPAARIGVIGSRSIAFFSWEVATNAAVLTGGVSTVAFDNAWHTFEMWGDAVNITFAIDGAVVAATAAANIGTNAAYLYIETLNGATAAARTHNIDREFMVVPSN